MSRIYLTFLIGIGGALFSSAMDYLGLSAPSDSQQILLIGGDVEEARLGNCEHTLIEARDNVVSLRCAN